MADAAFDTLAAARRLRDARVEPARAEAIAETIGSAEGRMATKADMHRALWMRTGIIVAAVVALPKLLP